jgi:hypothetical protein
VLEGDGTNNVQAFNSGNGTPGTSFQYRFNVLPGDATHSTTTDLLASPAPATDANDLAVVFASNLTATTPATIFKDVDGSGGVNALDLSAIFPRLFTTLPGSLPGGMLAGSTLATTSSLTEEQNAAPADDLLMPSTDPSTDSNLSVDGNYEGGVDAVFGGLNDAQSLGESSPEPGALDEVFNDPFDDLLL